MHFSLIFYEYNPCGRAETAINWVDGFFSHPYFSITEVYPVETNVERGISKVPKYGNFSIIFGDAGPGGSRGN